MGKDMTAKFMQEYKDKYPLYSAFVKSVAELIDVLLKERGLKVHSITCRVKDEQSLRTKIQTESKYDLLQTVTDIAGARIITYFPDDVDQVAKIIEEEFEIDKENSVDKRTLLDPERFGYLSLHYVARLAPSRKKLTEYRRFEGMLVEIQVRSILQHAWAEIEHDLGYKSKEAIPALIRRRFSRLAGLLELADSEFSHIRDDLEEYRQIVRKEIPKAPAEIKIDQASLSEFISQSHRVKEMDSKIASMVGATLLTSSGVMLIRALSYLGFENLAEIGNKLETLRGAIMRFAEAFLGDKKRGMLIAGISVFFMCHVIIALKGTEEVVRYLVAIGVRQDEIELQARRIMEAWDAKKP